MAGQQVRLIRAMKPFKIARLLKLGKSAAVITVLMDYYEISPKQGKTLQVSGAGFAQQRLAYRCSKMCCLVWVGPEPSLDRRRAHDVQIHLKTGDGLVGGCGAYIRMHHLAWEGCCAETTGDPKQEIELFLETIPWGSTGQHFRHQSESQA